MSCNGGCCATFTLGAADLAAMTAGTVKDSSYIANMLVELSLDQAAARRKRFDLPPWPEASGHGEHWKAFTCRHWDEETRLCREYESRPGMCRKYPYLAECAGCGMRAQASTEEPAP